MLRRVFPFIVLLLIVANGHLIYAQNTSTARDPRANYDPLYASHPAYHHKSLVEKLRQHFNPANTNYGAVVHGYVNTVLLATVHELFFWLVIVMATLLGLETIYVYFLRRQRRVRLWVSSEIFAQLYNSYTHANEKACEAIEAHNALVKQRNKEFATPSAGVTMERPALAVYSDIYRQPDAVAAQRHPSSQSEVVHDLTDGFSRAMEPTAPVSIEQSLPSSGSSKSAVEIPSSSPGSSEFQSTDSREASSLEQANRQIFALQNKVKNLRSALNQRDDTIRSMKDEDGQKEL